jgi:hypothetical protein
LFAGLAGIPAHGQEVVYCRLGHGAGWGRARLETEPGWTIKSVRTTLTGAERQGYLDGMTTFEESASELSQPETLCCSFCNKDKSAIAKLIAGPGVYICNECVDLCNEILAEQHTSGFGGWDKRPEEELLANLAKMQATVSQVDSAVHDHVGLLRTRGVSWTRIGDALGVSKQAAWERFSGED